MGNGHRTAAGNLAFEERNNRTAASKHITETYHGKSPPGGFGSTQHNHFGQPFGCTHHIDRQNGLIRGDHYQLADAKLQACFDNIPRADHIVGYGLFNVFFHKRNMLMGCCMKDNLRMVTLKNHFKARKIPYIRNDWPYNQGWKTFLHLQQCLKDTVLSMANHNQFRWTPSGNLAAQFAAYGTTCTCNQNNLADQSTADAFILNPRWFTTQ